MSRITIVEVGPRDGLQNEAVVVDTDTKFRQSQAGPADGRR